MGFFHNENEVDQAKADRKAIKRRGSAPGRSGSNVDPSAMGCDACALKSTWARIATARMPLSGNTKDPDILVIGEAPGEEEDLKGEAFVGKSGKMLRENIPGRDYSRIAYTNSVRCRPDNNRTPSPQESNACSVHLRKDIESLPIKAILGVGSVPFNAMFSDIPAWNSIQRIHGTKMPLRIGDKAMWFYPVLHPAFVMRSEGKYGGGPILPVFESDMRKFFREVDTWGKPTITTFDPKSVIIPDTYEEALALTKKMRGPVAIDIETTKKKPFLIDARLLIASISDGITTIAFTVDHPEHQNPWGLELLLEIAFTRHWVAHNVQFELVWIMWHAEKMGLDKKRIGMFEDTMLQLRLYHERETLMGLAVGSRIHLGNNVKNILNVNAVRILEYPLIEQMQYCGLDSMATAPLYHKLYGQVNNANYERLLSSAENAAYMELFGFPVAIGKELALDWKPTDVNNYTTAKEFDKHWEFTGRQAEEDARKIYEVREFERDRGTKFNLSAPDDVASALVHYGRIQLPKNDDSGKWSTDDTALNTHAKDHPLTPLVFLARESAKMRSTYVRPILEVPTTYVDGLLHGGYKTGQTATLRYAGDDPNLQNWPKRKHKQVRKMIIARVGHLIVAIDYGQLQVRIIAMMSDDRNLKRQLVDGTDMHTRWLNECLDIYPDYLDRLANATGENDEDKIRKAGRTIIKSDFVFSSFFGSSPESIAGQTMIPVYEVNKLHKRFWAEFSSVHSWIKKVRRDYRETGSSVLPSKRVRHGIMPGNEPINNPVQGAEADIVQEAQKALIAHAKNNNDDYFLPCINIHDDLSFMLRDDETLPKYIETIANIMVEPRFDWITVPLTVEVSIGYNWAELYECGLFKGDYYR